MIMATEEEMTGTKKADGPKSASMLE